MEVLQSCISPKQLRKDAGVQAESDNAGGDCSTDKEQQSGSPIPIGVAIENAQFVVLVNLAT